jgi:hypothetical protein
VIGTAFFWTPAGGRDGGFLTTFIDISIEGIWSDIHRLYISFAARNVVLKVTDGGSAMYLLFVSSPTQFDKSRPNRTSAEPTGHD